MNDTHTATTQPMRSEAAGREPASDWGEIKSRFVDDPEGAVAAADDLVRTAVEQKIARLQQELDELRASAPEKDSPTEELRTRLIRYQAYYENLCGTSAH